MKSELLRFLSEQILSGQSVELQSSDDLLGTETLDSMGIMRLIAFIEERFKLRVPPEDVTIENFFSVDTICEYLRKSLSADLD